MSTTDTHSRGTTGAGSASPGNGRLSPWRAALRFAGRHVVVVAAIGSLAYLLLPVAVVILLSFNKPAGRYNTTFNEFTLSNWTDMCSAGGMCDALVISLQIAVLATLGGTLLGSAIAFALVRHRFRGRSSINMLIFLPMATPEVVMGSSLLTLFVSMQMRLGFMTLLIAHIMFTLSFVVVTVKARLSGIDPHLEEAARDLYANPWSTFWRITFPLALPGIVAAAMLAFALSFDDFIVSNFNAGNEVNFPMFVWGAARRGVPPEVNVVGTLMFVVALVAVVGGQWAVAQRNKSR